MALLLRLFLLMSGTWMGVDVVMTYSTYDSNRYVVLADNLREGHGFRRGAEEGPVHLAIEKLRGPLKRDDDGFFAEAFRTPGYPVYLMMFGGRSGLNTALFVQCVLGAFAAILVVGIARKLEISGSLAVGWLWALHPALVTTDVLVLTESLFTFIGVLALAIALERPNAIGHLAAGILIGFDGLVRPLGLLYLVPILILAWPKQHRILSVLLLCGVSVLPSVLWADRNNSEGYGRRVSTVGEINLYYYGGSYVLSESQGRDWQKYWRGNIDTLSAALNPGDDAFTAMRAAAIDIYKQHPAATAKVAAKSQVKLMFDHSMDYLLAQYRLDLERTGMFSDLLAGKLNLKSLGIAQVASLLWMALNALITLLAALGLLKWLRRRQWRLFFGCLLPILLFSAASFPVGLERFRVPFMLFLFLPAAFMVSGGRQPPAAPQGADAPRSPNRL